MRYPTENAGLEGPGLRDKLRRSYFFVAMIGLAMLAVSMGMTFWLRASAIRLAQERGPAVRASMQALSGVQRSLAELEALVAFGEESCKTRRAAAWTHEIRPALAELQSAEEGTLDIPKEGLAQLAEMVDRLDEVQQQIEAVALTPANQPARVLYGREESTVVRSIDAVLVKWLSAPKTAGDLRSRIVSFRSALLLADALLRHFVSDGEAAVEGEFRSALAEAGQELAEVGAQRDLLSSDQQVELSRIESDVAAYVSRAGDIVSLRKGAGWNKAQELMVRQAIPQGRRITNSLHGISAGQIELMKVDAALVNTVSLAGLYLMLLPIGGMAWAVYRVSARAAEDIARPIIALAEATRLLAAGKLTVDIEVEGTDEVAHLTRAFNAMRAALAERTRQVEETTASIRTTVTHLARATADILSSTKALVAGAESQAADVDRTRRAVDDTARVAEKRTAGATALAQSAEWADAIGKIGIKTVDASVYAMERMAEEVKSLTATIRTLAHQAQQVGEVVDRMSEVAEQTRVLASNAGQEGARLGDAGKALSYVADEVEALADQSRSGAWQVRDLLGEIRKTMNDAVMTTETASTVVTSAGRVVNRASDTIKTLSDVATDASRYSHEVLQSADQQAADMGEIRQAVAQISQVAQTEVASARQVEDVAKDLHALGERLAQLLAGYERR